MDEDDEVSQNRDDDGNEDGEDQGHTKVEDEVIGQEDEVPPPDPAGEPPDRQGYEEDERLANETLAPSTTAGQEGRDTEEQYKDAKAALNQADGEPSQDEVEDFYNTMLESLYDPAQCGLDPVDFQVNMAFLQTLNTGYAVPGSDKFCILNSDSMNNIRSMNCLTRFKNPWDCKTPAEDQKGLSEVAPHYSSITEDKLPLASEETKQRKEPSRKEPSRQGGDEQNVKLGHYMNFLI